MTLLILKPKKFLIYTLWVKLKIYLASLDDVDHDGEMGVGQDHLELVSHLDSSHHVLDGGLDGTNSGVSLFLLEPHPELE